jgi:hypothetical protein
MREARHLEDLKYGTHIGTRKTRRIGPAETGPRPKRARKWRAAFRGDDAGSHALSEPYPVRRGGGYLIEENDDDEGEASKSARREAALRGIRRLRAESSKEGEPTGSERARRRQRQRQARVVEDESTDDEGSGCETAPSLIGPADVEVET